MIISRDNGLINEYFSIVKGQLIDLYYFSTIGETPNDQEQTYAVKDNKTGEIIWVPEKDIKKYKSGKVNVLELI